MAKATYKFGIEEVLFFAMSALQLIFNALFFNIFHFTSLIVIVNTSIIDKNDLVKLIYFSPFYTFYFYFYKNKMIKWVIH